MELKRKNIRLKDYDYSKEGYYYITICIKNRKEILSKIKIYNTKLKSNDVGVGVPDDPEKIQIELTTYGEIIKKQIKEINNIYKDIKIENYIIMPNHVHMIIEISKTRKRVVEDADPYKCQDTNYCFYVKKTNK